MWAPFGLLGCAASAIVETPGSEMAASEARDRGRPTDAPTGSNFREFDLRTRLDDRRCVASVLVVGQREELSIRPRYVAAALNAFQ